MSFERMHISSFFVLSSLLSLGVARTIAGSDDCLPAGRYTLCQNPWGEDAGVGSQSSTLVSTTTNTVSWSTNYTWANGPTSVKSYANVLSNPSKGVQLKNVASAPTVWNWDYTSQSGGLRADVAYDIWFGNATSGAPASSASRYEIMIWLSSLGGIQPIGRQITTATPIANQTWNLWKGTNKHWKVYSFVSAAGEINDFNADLNAFFKYLVKSQGIRSTQYIQAIQAGTEPFVGTASFVTKSYSVSIESK
ncbi:endocellulase [Roridomyces roridus]|uniref:Endocellulase n=1 Tax=Roridomyces roridus TaxID=1738132 RepID=A0AAD7FZN1_9AGAR|nr:endocellulase [Roridomyces roridus]